VKLSLIGEVEVDVLDELQDELARATIIGLSMRESGGSPQGREKKI
jgi:hypothetical protein